MNLSPEQVQKYLTWLKENKSYADIRKDLTEQGFMEIQITEIIKTIDNVLIEKDLQKAYKFQKIDLMLAGIFAIGIGLFLTVYAYFYAGHFEVGLKIIFVGIALFLAGWRKSLKVKFSQKFKRNN